MEEYKICTKCSMEKSLIKFCKDKRNKSGYCSWCKFCKNTQVRELRKDGFDGECKDNKNKYKKEYLKARRRNDPEFKLLENLRVRLSNALRGKSKSQTTKQLIGLDFKIFTKWIEFQLEEGMVLENYGSIFHLDHVLPISSFNLLDEEELHKAMNWVNIRPCTPLKNIQKSNKIDTWLYIMQQVKADYFLKHLDEL